MTPARVCFGALLATICLAVAPGGAQARVTALALPGGVFVQANDDERHDLMIWDSRTDVRQRTLGRPTDADFVPSTQQAGADYAAEFELTAMRHLRDADFRRLELNQRTLEELLDALPNDLSPNSKSLIDAYHANLDEALTEMRRYGEQVLRYQEAQNELRAILDTVDQFEIEQLEEALVSIQDELDETGQVISNALDRARALRTQVQSLPDVPNSIKQGLGRVLRSSILRANRFAQHGFVTLGYFKHLAALGIAADVAYTLYTATSKDRVLIADRAGGEVKAAGLCQKQVRNTEGGRQVQVASCPIVHFPFAAATAVGSLAVGLMVGFTEATVGLPSRGLYVTGGGGTDRIRLNIDPENNQFSNIVVSGGAGPDTIGGSAVGERLIGGGGNDSILGNGGNDDISGGHWPDGVSDDPANDNDRLFGGPGEDIINGEQGDDLIFGGAGDDWRYAGSALYGGDGNDVIVGGPGRDEMAGGEGRDSIFARESDFRVDWGSSTMQANAVDYVVDCGDSPDEQYVTVGSSAEIAEGCTPNVVLPPIAQPTMEGVISARPVGGSWPWFR